LRGGEFVVLTDRLAHERAIAGIQSALTESEIEAAWTAGRQLTVAKAIDEIHALAPADDAIEHATSSALNLSPREMEVLRLLVAGLPDRAIAETLFLSVRTVEAHVARILDKLDVHTRTAAVTVAMSAGLIEPNFGANQARH
jgi:DNA-binding NarL/FixJ family response regulator